MELVIGQGGELRVRGAVRVLSQVDQREVMRRAANCRTGCRLAVLQGYAMGAVPLDVGG
jgi:hypothetical protein